MPEIFEENIKEYDLLELVNWIKRCRSYVKDSYEWKSSNKNPEEYRKMVLSFITEWENHYKENEKFYGSELYKKAILGAGLPDDIVNIKNKKGETVSLPANVFFNKLSNQKITLTYKEKLKKQLDDYYNWFNVEFDKLNKDNYRREITKLIIEKAKNYTYDFYLDYEDLLNRDIDTIISLLKDEDIDKTIINKADDELQSKLMGGILSYLYKWDIAKQQYYNYRNIYKTKKVNGKKVKVVIELQKKLIINLGLFFSLDIDNFEKFVQMHGYSIKNSFEERDILLSHLLKFGVSKEYIDIALENRNFYNLKKRDCFDDRDFYFNILMKYIDKIKAEKAVYSKDDVKKILTAGEYKEYEKVRKVILEKTEEYIIKTDKKINTLQKELVKNPNKETQDELDQILKDTHFFSKILNSDLTVITDTDKEENITPNTPIKKYNTTYEELKNFLNQLKEA